MAELEKIIEEKLIDQLVYGESQWIYREDLKTEEDLWKNFKYILEQNNKDRLNGEPLSDAEFAQVKNQLQFSSFYKAGEWLVGENGKVMVHIQRDTERLHLVVMNHEHIAGGSSVYEVINQYSALKTDDVNASARDRRFDVTLMINGLPMIDVDYQLMAYSNTKIDYEYIINLIQNIVTPNEDIEDVSPEERQKQIDEVKQYVEEMQKDNPKVAEIMFQLINEIEQDENKYKGQSILNIVENMKHDCIDKVISDFCVTWYASKEDVMYAALHYRNGEIPNESVIKATIDYQRYKEAEQGKALQKFKYYAQCMAELRKTLDEEIKPLLSAA